MSKALIAAIMHIKSKTIAAIDLGSNSFRLLIAEFKQDEGLLLNNILVDELRPVRLNENLQQSGRLSARAISRGLAVCRLFAERLNQFAPTSLRICGTEALRSATNSYDFITAAQKLLPVKIEILNAAEEAELTLRGCIGGLVTEDNIPALLVDAGGGSTELIIAEPHGTPEICSLPIGAVNLTESFLPSRPEPSADITRLENHLQGIIRPAYSRLIQDNFSSANGFRLWASGGTATALATLDLGLDRYRASLIQGHKITAKSVDKIANMISKLNTSGRDNLPGLNNRGEIILAGIKIYQAILKIMKIDHLVISASGLLEGILLSTIRCRDKCFNQ